MPTTKPIDDKTFPFKMGCDPEFTMLMNDKRADVAKVFHELKLKGKTGGAKDWRTPKMKGSIGTDTGNATGEMRPAPANSPQEMVDNIKSILQEVMPNLPVFGFTTLSFYSPIGGHIHLDLPKKLPAGITISFIERFILSFYLPMVLGENPVSQAIREGTSYGKISLESNTFRSQDWGIEFRAPSAEWLTCPKTTRAVFAYLGTIMHEVLHHPANTKKLEHMMIKNTKQAELLLTVSKSGYEAFIKAELRKIKIALRSFELYKVHKSDIDFVLSPKAFQAEKAKYGYDMRKGWGFEEIAPTYSKKSFITLKGVKKVEHSLSDEFLQTCISLPYNKDINVEFFANKITERMAALGWRPKNDYYLFGLKQGTKNIRIANEGLDFATPTDIFTTANQCASCRDVFSYIFKNAKAAFTKSSTIRIDHVTGRVSRQLRPIVCIALPYEIRKELQVDEMLGLIYEIESGDSTFKGAKVVKSKDATDEWLQSSQDVTMGAHTALNPSNDTNDIISTLTKQNQGYILPGQAESVEDWVERIKKTGQYYQLLDGWRNQYGWYTGLQDNSGNKLMLTDPDKNNDKGWIVDEYIKNDYKNAVPDIIFIPNGVQKLAFSQTHSPATKEVPAAPGAIVEVTAATPVTVQL